ncbi:MAG: type II toxin-antitoxin system RelE/ParE family toxin [Phycisphaerales bacterium]
MKHRVIVETRAAADIEAYAAWIASQGAPANAVRWAESIRIAVESLAIMPGRCPLAPESESLGLEVRQLVHHPHRILFLVRERTVHVLHVRHGARLPLSE